MPATRTATMSNTAYSLLGKLHSSSLLFFHLFQKHDTIKAPQDVSCLTNLPVEIILLVLDHLASADAVCFALACKAIFSILRARKDARKIMQLNSHAKQILLMRLEKDVPGLVYRPYSNKLVPFDGDGQIAFKTPYQKAPSGQFSYFSPMTRSRHWAIINYEQTRLVRNYRLFGPGHGVPLWCLSHEAMGPKTRVKLVDGQLEKYFTSWQTARWVGDDLLLSCTQTTYLKILEEGQVDDKTLWKLIAGTSTPMCHHCDSNHPFHAGIPAGIPRLFARISVTSCRSTGSCGFCETDWDVIIAWDHFLVSFAVRYITYHDLGSCSLPFDPKWERMTSFAPDSPTREGLCGDVKRRWKEAVEKEVIMKRYYGGCMFILSIFSITSLARLLRYNMTTKV